MGWRIKDVAARLLIDEPVQVGTLGRALPLLARGQFTPDRVNAAWIAKTRGWPSTRVLTVFAEDSRRKVGA